MNINITPGSLFDPGAFPGLWLALDGSYFSFRLFLVQNFFLFFSL